MKKKAVFLGIALCLAGPPSFYAQHQASLNETTPSLKKNQTESIRLIQETAFFIFQHYSMIDAALLAQEQGKDYGTSLWTGSASALPGAGELIDKEYLKGDGLLLGSFFCAATLNELGPKESDLGEGANARWAEGLKFLQWGLQSYATMDAAFTAVSADPTYDRAFWIGAASLLPGAGQFINKDWAKGGGLLAGFILTDRLINTFENFAKKERHIEAFKSSGALQYSLAFVPGRLFAGFKKRF